MMDIDGPVPPLKREPSAAPTIAAMLDGTGATIYMAGHSNAAEQGVTNTDPIADTPGGGYDNDDEATHAARPHTLKDYVDVSVNNFTGELHNIFTCPRPHTQCDGFVFDSLEECLAHERDWHAGPYTCLICGQVFASGPRLRRHEHYDDAEERRAELEAAEARRGECYGIRVYHGNEPARRRARQFAKKVKLDEAIGEKKRAKESKKQGKRIIVAIRKEEAKKNKKDGPLVVIGAQAGVLVAAEEEEDAKSCEEPCCPFFEKSFVNSAAYRRHVASHGHEAAVRMNGALLRQLTTMAMATPSLTVGHSPRSNVEVRISSRNRESTPPPLPTTQLLSPPPTPHTADDGEDWDDRETLPMMLEARLASTQRALRELRCNAPGCGMYGRRMASSQGYWAHLASEGHAAALRAWSARGGEAVYVGA